MLVTEVSVYEKLRKLKSHYGLYGIKAEFGEEGASFRELMRLCRISSDLDISVYLKIGGVEAKTDAKDAFELDIKGVIAPMVESPFGLEKFVSIIDNVYGAQPVYKAINIETKGSVENLEEILDYAVGKIDQVTVGRSDLSASYFNKDIYPDSEFILNKIREIGLACKKRNIKMGIGGSVSKNTINIFRGDDELRELIQFIETRKVILPTRFWFANDNVINAVLDFEKSYVESVAAFNNYHASSEMKRIDELKRRVSVV